MKMLIKYSPSPKREVNIVPRWWLNHRIDQGKTPAEDELASQFQKAQGKVILNMNHIHVCVMSKLCSVSC